MNRTILVVLVLALVMLTIQNLFQAATIQEQRRTIQILNGATAPRPCTQAGGNV